MTDVLQAALSTGPLLLPVPEKRSDQYAAGWAYADAHIQKGGSLAEMPPQGWSEDKEAGYIDRIGAARVAAGFVGKEGEANHA